MLNIVYLTPNVANGGGFFPYGVNGPLHESGPALPGDDEGVTPS